MIPLISFIYSSSLLFFLLWFSLFGSLSRGEIEPVLKYDFLRSDCLNGIFPQKSSNFQLLTDLFINQINGICPQSNGIQLSSNSRNNAAISSMDLSTLLTYLKDKNTFTFDFWLDTRNNFHQDATQALLEFTSTSSSSKCNTLQISQSSLMNSTNSRRLSSSGLDTNALGGELDVILCNRQGTRLNVYSQGFPKSSSKTSFIYYTLTLTFSQSLYSPTPKSVVPVYVVEMNSSTRTYPKSGQSLQSTMYYDYDISLSGSFHPSQLLTTQLMGKDTFLTILPHSTNGNFGGTLLSMSLYDRALTSTEINQNLLNGLPNSLPVVSYTTFTINEDGQSEESLTKNYGNPLYNDYLPCEDLQVLSLPMFDIDDVSTHPNYLRNQAANIYQASSIILLSLPLNGVLYAVDSACNVEHELQLQHRIIRGQNGKYEVKYRPNPNEHSKSADEIFDYFQIQGVDGITGRKSQEVANISLIVLPTNDVPVANSSLMSVTYSQVYTFITLAGNDLDSNFPYSPTQPGTTLLHARIHSLPKFGALFFRSSNSSIPLQKIHLLSGSSIALDAISPFSLVYIFTGDVLSLSESDPSLVGRDSFLFSVEDSAFVDSTPVTFNIEVRSSLMPMVNNSDSSLVVESELSVIKIFGYDISDTDRDMWIQINRFPSHGKLYDVSPSLVPLSSGMRWLSIPMEMISCSSSGLLIPTQHSTRNVRCGVASIGYLSDSSYFSLPDVDWNGTSLFPSIDRRDSFTYSIISQETYNFTTKIVEVSSEIETRIQILNLNQPTELLFSYQREDWKSLNSIQINSYRSSNLNPFNFTSVSNIEISSCLATITGFNLIDPDLGVDIIRADIHINGPLSYISLNSQYLSDVIFNGDLWCFSSSQWGCVGDGFFDPSLTFIGTPHAIEKVLNGMQYLSLISHHTDFINITLYDGVDGSCLSSRALSSPPHPHAHRQQHSSIRHGCYITSISLQVVVLDYYSDPTSPTTPSRQSSKFSLKWSRTTIIIGVAILLLFLVLSALYYHCIVPCIRCWRNSSSCCRQSGSPLPLEKWSASGNKADGGREDNEEEEGVEAKEEIIESEDVIIFTEGSCVVDIESGM